MTQEFLDRAVAALAGLSPCQFQAAGRVFLSVCVMALLPNLAGLVLCFGLTLRNPRPRST
jgi:hypothetical protein